MATGAPQPHFDFRGPDGWQRNLLIGLFAVYVLELVCESNGIQLRSLLQWGELSGSGLLAAPWQPFSRYLVQGANVVNVVIQLLVLYLALPTMNDLVGERAIAPAFLAGVVGGTLLPLLVALLPLPLGTQALLGWGALVMVPFVLLGILRPNATVYLIIFPVEARWILWGSLAVSLLGIIGYRSVASFEYLGVWLGTYLWWTQIRPSRTRRAREPDKPPVMRQRAQFQVIEGGAGGDDDMVH